MARIDGATYPLGVHGFARFETFALIDRDVDRARFVLRDTPATRAQYPFHFELSVEYRLEPRRLSIEARVINSGERTMPYAFGLHPGFRWPLGGGDKAEISELQDG